MRNIVEHSSTAVILDDFVNETPYLVVATIAGIDYRLVNVGDIKVTDANDTHGESYLWIPYDYQLKPIGNSHLELHWGTLRDAIEHVFELGEEVREFNSPAEYAAYKYCE